MTRVFDIIVFSYFFLTIPIPMFKKGSPVEKNNYGQISFIPFISKLIKKVIHDLTQKYCSKKIVYKCQSGFRANHSTGTCLSYVNDKILKGFDRGEIMEFFIITSRLIELSKFSHFTVQIISVKRVFIVMTKMMIQALEI